MKEVFFVRHGESEANSRNICAGHTDVELTDRGINQAKRAGQELSETGRAIQLIISSPLKRALFTATEIAKAIGYPTNNIEIDADAIERFRGDFEGKPSSAQDGVTDGDYVAHGAESEDDMLVRAERLLQKVSHRKEQTCLIVSHNQFGRTLVAHAKGAMRHDIDKLPNAHVFRVDMPTTTDFMREIVEATADYPHFADGRIDYTNERECYVLNCVVVCGERVLLTKRGADVIAYTNTINGVSGFIDDTKNSLEQTALNELTEELSLPREFISSLSISRPFIQIDETINRKWHVFAVLVEISSEFAPKVNWENKSAEWFSLTDTKDMKLMRGFKETLSMALTMRNV